MGQHSAGSGSFALQLPVQGDTVILSPGQAGEIPGGQGVELGGEALLQSLVGGVSNCAVLIIIGSPLLKIMAARNARNSNLSKE